MAGRIMMKL